MLIIVFFTRFFKSFYFFCAIFGIFAHFFMILSIFRSYFVCIFFRLEVLCVLFCKLFPSLRWLGAVQKLHNLAGGRMDGHQKDMFKITEILYVLS